MGRPSFLLFNQICQCFHYNLLTNSAKSSLNLFNKWTIVNWQKIKQWKDTRHSTSFYSDSFSWKHLGNASLVRAYNSFLFWRKKNLMLFRKSISNFHTQKLLGKRYFGPNWNLNIRSTLQPWYTTEWVRYARNGMYGCQVGVSLGHRYGLKGLNFSDK